jgi:hypothetical protein
LQNKTADEVVSVLVHSQATKGIDPDGNLPTASPFEVLRHVLLLPGSEVAAGVLVQPSQSMNN